MREGIVRRVCRMLQLALTLVIFADAVYARNPPETPEVRKSNVTGHASFVTAAGGGPISVKLPMGRVQPRPADFLEEYGHLYGITDPLRQLAVGKTRTDLIGHTHTTYKQVHGGVPVFSGMLNVHQDARGRIVAANGDFYPVKPTLNTVPTLKVDAAIAQAMAEITVGDPSIEQSELVIVDPGWYGDPPLGEHLAYYIVLTDLTVPLRDAFFVDAHTGAILDRWSMICDVRLRSIHDAEGGSDCCFANGSAGCDQPACEQAVCEVDSSCCDEEWDRICAIRAAQYCDSLCLPGPLARSEGNPPTGVPDVDAAYDYYGDTYDYLFRAFGRDGIDDAGMAMIATVNSPAPGCPNAFWSGSRQQMVFCPGTVTDDIVAHELSHGMTEHTANLIYQNQSGQLNESFSDVFGELIDLFNGDVAFAGPPGGVPWPTHPTGPGQDTPNNPRTTCSGGEDEYPDGVRWLVGEDAAVFGGAIRDMWNPPCFGDPDRANSPLQTCNILDSGGVHSGSGIPNHAFALLVDGGSFNGHTVNGIGPIKAATVWYRALTTYLTIASDFDEAYAALNQAALDLVGTFPNDPRTGAPSPDMFTPADAAEVETALLAVEMDTPGRCGWTVHVLNSDPPSQCVMAAVIFEDDFEGGINGWSVSNSGPPTPYDWVQTDALPFGRDGTAWFCENGGAGDCDNQDESASHSLFSPPVNLPPDADFPYLAFTHYMESERGYDGGNLSVRVNGGEWQAVARTVFEFNPYNSILRSASSYENTNPLAGQQAWTGVGGRWGTSVVDLSSFADGGDTIEVRFDFGKDGCNGLTGWYVDDFVVYSCPDCNANGAPDHHEFVFTTISEPLQSIEPDFGYRFRIGLSPPAAGDVTLSFASIGDFSSESEYLRVEINGTPVGEVFRLSGSDCPATPNSDTIVVPAAVYNAAVGDGVAWIGLMRTGDVSLSLCRDGFYLTIFVQYELDPTDADDNGVPDECEWCAPADAPTFAPTATAKNRYISFVPGDPGRLTALRVTFVDLPAAFEALEGTQMWVGAPSSISEIADRLDEEPPVFTGARLTCEPVFLDWSTVGTVHVYDDEIVPGAMYEVQAIDLACGQWAEAYYSAPLTLLTSRWGDLAGRCDVTRCTPPDGTVGMISDVTAVLDKFKNLPGSPIKARADLGGAVPNAVVDMADVALAIDAFRGFAYPFARPEGCP
ncbi:MAG: M4 family metallopeptidase [Phycisphaerales bacterium]|nr:MAG: M4 family metallopeptidase [Phycisphaerales bacterium]